MENVIIIGWMILFLFLLYCIFEEPIEKHCYKNNKKQFY